jgi:hypothetical protein
MKNEMVFNGFDYTLQVWVIDGKIQNCGHPETMQCGCKARKLAGQDIASVVASV